MRPESGFFQHFCKSQGSRKAQIAAKMQLVMAGDLDALREDDDLAPHLANRRENADDYGTVCAITALSRRY